MSERAPGSEEPAPGAPRSPRRAKRSLLREVAGIVLVGLVAALLLRTFVVQAFSIPSTSMLPTLHVGDRVFVNKLVYVFGDIQRFDVIVFRDPDGDDRGVFETFVDWLTEGFGLSQPAEKDFIKRVLAFPGETWEIGEGRLFVNGVAIEEPYLKLPLDTRSFPLETVPERMLLVLGDNRLESEDSRFDLGYVPIGKVVGKAFIIVWPPSRIGWIAKPETSTATSAA